MLYSNLRICTQVQKSNNEERTSFAIRFCMLVTESIQQWTKRKSHSLSSKLFVIFVSSGKHTFRRTNANLSDIFVGFFQHNHHTHMIVPKICSKYSIVSLFIAFQKQILKIALNCPNLFKVLELSIKSHDPGARTASFSIIGHQMCNWE
jgi:hypothetical protein